MKPIGATHVNELSGGSGSGSLSGRLFPGKEGERGGRCNGNGGNGLLGAQFGDRHVGAKSVWGGGVTQTHRLN